MTQAPRELPSEATGFAHVVGGPLRGLTLACAAPLTILVDADGASPSQAAYALRLLAGIARPRSGKVLALGGDPAERAGVRRATALLGDDVLVDPNTPLVEAACAVGATRGVATLLTPALVRAWLAEHAPDATLEVQRRRLADALAAPESARLVLASHPEQAAHPEDRDRVLEQVRNAVRRGARAVVATSRLDDVLAFAEGIDAVGAVLHGGVLLVAGPAHGLPWALSASGAQTRVIRVAVADDHDEGRPPPAQRLASELLADPEVAAALAAIEPLGRVELRLHVRDARRVARAIAARAKAGAAITRFVLHGSSAEELAAAYGSPRAQGARW